MSLKVFIMKLGKQRSFKNPEADASGFYLYSLLIRTGIHLS